eukprot:1652159-Amphidinium_carterae.1
MPQMTRVVPTKGGSALVSALDQQLPDMSDVAAKIEAAKQVKPGNPASSCILAAAAATQGLGLAGSPHDCCPPPKI